MRVLEKATDLMSAAFLGESRTTEFDHSFLQIARMPLFAKLAPMQRVMLMSNGTLTDILQAFTLEKIGVHKLTEERLFCYHSERLDLSGNEAAIKRSVVLYGLQSAHHYVYAETYLALEHLPQALARDLCEGSEPLGRLILKHKIETFKELIDLRIGKSDKAARYLESSLGFLVRKYKTYVQRRPCIVVHEYFPAP